MLAQQTTVGGTIVDEKTGRPLPQVSVSVGRISVVTNEDGAFLLKLGDKPSSIMVFEAPGLPVPARWMSTPRLLVRKKARFMQPSR